MTEAETKMRRILSDVLNLRDDEITDSVGIGTVRNWDSLKHMAIVMALEEGFGLQPLEMEEIVAMTTVSEIKRVLGFKGVMMQGGPGQAN